MKLEKRSLRLSIVINLLVSAIKIVGGILFNTFTLVIDGIYTVSDLVTDVFALIGIQIGRRRANKNHPYGYGRIFFVILLFMGLIALIVGIFVIYLSFKIDYQKPSLWIILIIIGAILLKLYSAKTMFKVGTKTKSDLLIASSLESKMEAYSSFALIFVVLLSLFIPKIDMIGGILIALLLIWQALKVIKENISFLIGITYDDGIIENLVKKITKKYRIIDVTHISIMKDGPYYQIILTVKARRNVKVASLIRVQNKIKKELKATTLGLKFIEFHIT